MADHKAWVLEYKNAFKQQVEDKMKGGGDADPYASYKVLAD